MEFSGTLSYSLTLGVQLKAVAATEHLSYPIGGLQFVARVGWEGCEGGVRLGKGVRVVSG